MFDIKAMSLTIFVGIFFLIGILIPKFIKEKKKCSFFANGLAFSVMLGMILFDIIPEISEKVIPFANNTKFYMIAGFTICGIFLLKGLDLLIPHHNHHHDELEKSDIEHNEHLFHIGFVTCLSLILHNMIEGISIYATGLTDLKLGMIMALAVSLHNIPLGIEVGVGYFANQEKNTIKKISIIFLIFSSFIGSFLLAIFGGTLSDFALVSLLCVTFGMLIYISLFELLKEIWMNKKQKPIYYGILLGVILTIIMVLL